MAQLPLFKDPNQQLMLMQTRWKSLLDPILGNPILSGNPVNNVNLIVGSTFINHGLQRVQQGWFPTDIQGPANIYRDGGFNSTTLVIASNAAVTISIWCY